MKFRLKIGHLYGPLSPDLNGGRTYGMYMVPWIKSVKAEFGLGLKEAKSLADCLRAHIEEGDHNFSDATVDVDIVQFPFLARVHVPFPSTDYVEFVGHDEPGLACTVNHEPFEGNPSVKIIKAAMRELLDINAWTDVRRLAEVLMDIEDEQSV